MIRKTDGFTLVELLVSILCGSLVMAAAASLMLFGARAEKASIGSASDQQSVRIVLTMLENLADSGKISAVTTVSGSTGAEPDGKSGWVLLDGDGNSLVIYNAVSGTLSAGGGTVLMDGVASAKAELSETKLLTFSLQLDDGTQYSTSVFCRVPVRVPVGDKEFQVNEAVVEGRLLNEAVEHSVSENSGRARFLKELLSQYGSDGSILTENGPYGDYVSWYESGWSLLTTAWCACYVSWAVNQESVANALDVVPRFAHVNDGISWFKELDENGGWFDAAEEFTPYPGDLIFFDWERDGNPDHVGVVLLCENDVLYTIEGNSDDRVAVRIYSTADPRIYGYGVLPWKDTASASPAHTDGGAAVALSAEAAQKLSASTFANEVCGMQTMMNQVDKAAFLSTFLRDYFGSTFFSSPEFQTFCTDTLRTDVSSLTTDAEKENAAVLYAVNQALGMEETAIRSWLSDGSACNDLRAHLSSDAGAALTEAVLVYGMYAAYAYCKNDADAIAAVQSGESLDPIYGVGKDGFRNYMKEEQAAADLAGYLAVLSALDSLCGNPDAVADLLTNGVNGPMFVDMLQQAINGG